MSSKRTRKLLIKAAIVLGLFTILAVSLTGCLSGMTPIGWSGLAISDTGFAYTGTKEGRLASINLTNNSVQFAEPLRMPSTGGGFGCPSTGSTGSACGGSAPGVAIYGTPALANVPVLGNLVFIAGYNGKVFAYDAVTLQQRWGFPVEGNIDPIVSQIIASNGTLYFGGTDNFVYALEAATGGLKWKFATNDEVWSSPAVDGNRVFIGSFDKNIYALDATTGEKIWEFATGASNVSTPVVFDGIVYSGSLDRNMYAINASDGREVWRFEAGNWFWAKPIIVNGVVYAACLDSNIYALDAKTGNLIARYDAGGQISSSPVLVGNLLVAATQNERLIGIDVANVGAGPRLLANIPANVKSPLAARDNVVSLNAPDNSVYSYDIATGARFSPISLDFQQ